MADVRRLPAPVTDTWDWQMRASCRDLNSDLFFHPEHERGPARAEREARAKMICRGCPVIEQCRGHALTVREAYGVWGGLSEAERNERLRDDADHTVIGADFTPGVHDRPHGPAPDPWTAA